MPDLIAAPLAWARARRPRREDVKADVLAGLPGAVSNVPDGMAASLLAGVNPVHGLYACFAGPIAGGLTSSSRLMVVVTTSAAALAAGSALAVHTDERTSGRRRLADPRGGHPDGARRGVPASAATRDSSRSR